MVETLLGTWNVELLKFKLFSSSVLSSYSTFSILSSHPFSLCCRVYQDFIMTSQTETKTKNATFSPRMSRKPPFTAEVQGIPRVPGESIPRRNIRYPELLSQPELGIETVFDIVQQSSRRFGDARALGSRKLIKKHNETKKVKKIIDGQTQEVDKVWTYFEMSGYEYLSFKEYEATVLNVGAGLRKLGLVKDDRVHLFATTRYVSMLYPTESLSLS